MTFVGRSLACCRPRLQIQLDTAKVKPIAHGRSGSERTCLAQLGLGSDLKRLQPYCWSHCSRFCCPCCWRCCVSFSFVLILYCPTLLLDPKDEFHCVARQSTPPLPGANLLVRLSAVDSKRVCPFANTRRKPFGRRPTCVPPTLGPCKTIWHF